MQILKKSEFLSEIKKYNRYFFNNIEKLLNGKDNHRFSLNKEDIVFLHEILNLRELYALLNELDSIMYNYSINRNINLKKLEGLKLSKKRIEKITTFLDKYSLQIVDKKWNYEITSINNFIEFNNFLDLITHFVDCQNINDHIFLNFINLLDKKDEENICLLSYLTHYKLAVFFHLISDFINEIKDTDIINIKSKSISKKNYYYSAYKKFIILLNKEYSSNLIDAYKYLGYLNISLDGELLEIIKNLLNKEFNKTKLKKDNQDNSHYVQGAYLEHICGIQVKYKDAMINIKETSPKNLYCKPYFYGNSVAENSIEKKLHIIEREFINYIFEIKNRVNTKATVKDKIYFLINFIRTPYFLQQLSDNYIIFSKNHIENHDISHMDYKSVVEEVSNYTNYHENMLFFKNFQINFLNFFWIHLKKMII